MPVLTQPASLKDYQRYVTELEKERGFDSENVFQKCLLLGEEVGELFKAIRKNQGMVTDNKSKFTAVSEEVADVFILLCSIANRLNVDLESAFIEKEAVNAKRNWK